MGCGASNSTTAVSVDPMATNRVDPQPVEEINKIVKTSYENQRRILLSYHSHRQTIVEQFSQGFIKDGFACHLIDENQPKLLNIRAQLIQWCDFYFVFVDRNYHRTYSCMEALTYAKDIHKPIISVLIEPTFQPYGALGAISASAIHSSVVKDSQTIPEIIREVSNFVGNQSKMKSDSTRNTDDPLKVDQQEPISQLHWNSKPCVVLICTTDEGLSIAELILEHLLADQPAVLIENLSSNESSSVNSCQVFVSILNQQFEQTKLCQKALEQARLQGKPIIPVISAKKWRPEGWLGLLIAGRTFFRIFDRETAEKPFYDSNRITDLRFEIKAACSPAPSIAEREDMEKEVIEKELKELKSKLSQWPTTRKIRPINTMKKREPVRVKIPEPRATAEFSHTHYSYTRLTREAPPTLDDRGLPLRRRLDCMISYQWDKQDLVRQIFEDLHSRQVLTWFDIWGAMKGGTNDAMATGVECSKVLLLFLSKAYVTSVNCRLEFRYAIQRGKAFVILFTESDIPMESWMLEAIEGFPQYQVPSYDVLPETINGVPMIDAIVQSIRILAEAQPEDTIDDGSTELAELRCLLDDARDAFCAETSQERYKTCTRCGQIYDEYAKNGCKKHSAYFLGGGGGLLEDQWVCCRQQTADSPGCIPADHIDQPRVFIEDPTYGSSSWKPA